ncbi:hypothetical protein GCM10022381_25600 [Leifsonia kafniensis]|uniref:Htaa domain-containing protein n=1 Tax=Leifsonia kafniensis TaxID=475957 RepID=A0ABP7KLX0_9MICO
MAHLSWTVKESLLSYVVDRAGGVVDVETPAKRSADGSFWFPAVGREFADAGTGSVTKFAGGVRLRGHGGMLDLPLRDPWIEQTAIGFVLTIVDPDDVNARLPFVTMEEFVLRGNSRFGVATSMTADGADLIFGPYEAGTPFDDPVLHDVSE